MSTNNVFRTLTVEIPVESVAEDKARAAAVAAAAKASVAALLGERVDTPRPPSSPRSFRAEQRR